MLTALFLTTLNAQESGNVGIGTTNPAHKLDVNGSIGLPVTVNSSTGILFKEGSPFLHDFKAPSSGSIGQNVFLGKNAGNFTMPGGANYLSSDNTGIGAAALFNLTTGYANTSVGSFALYSVQGGVQNSAVGLYGLFANISGNQNSVLGAYASKENTGGTGNVSVGFEANYYNQTGSYNTIIGYRAGKAGDLHNKTGNVFIGSYAGSNETGSNKLYVENSSSSTPLIGGDFSLDQVYLNGAVGIGTASPAASAKLEIAGTDKGFLPPRLTTAQINAIIGPATGLMVYNTTMNKPQFYDGSGWRNFDGTHYIGESLGGGIVFYIDGTGQHGLISATADQSSGANSGCYMTYIGGTLTAIGSGQNNTLIILGSCGEPGIAALICYDLVLNGYDDWFLPSKDELNEMYLQKNVIGGFSNAYYLSSSEFDDIFETWAQDFTDGYQTWWNRLVPARVRAVRAF